MEGLNFQENRGRKWIWKVYMWIWLTDKTVNQKVKEEQRDCDMTVQKSKGWWTQRARESSREREEEEGRKKRGWRELINHNRNGRPLSLEREKKNQKLVRSTIGNVSRDDTWSIFPLLLLQYYFFKVVWYFQRKIPLARANLFRVTTLLLCIREINLYILV